MNPKYQSTTGETDRRQFMAAVDSGTSAALTEISVEGICRTFWDLERDYDLLSWTVAGVSIWPLIRMQIYYQVTQKTGLFKPAHPSLKQHFRTPIEGDMSDLWTRVVATNKRKAPGISRVVRRLIGMGRPLVAQKRYAFLMSTRRVDGSEPYSDAVRSEARDDCILIDRPHVDGLLPGAFDIEQLKKHFRAIYAPKKAECRLSTADEQLCATLAKEFARRLGVEIDDLNARAAKTIRPFVAIRRGAAELFEAHGVQTLFLTHAYGVHNQAFVAGARDVGVRTIELQHGFISRFHLGYSWPGRPAVPNTPDAMWCFGDFWGETTPLPGGMTTRAIGAPYVKALAGTFVPERNKALVVFTSQGVIGDRLFDAAVVTARRRPEKQVIFRLHPSEGLEIYKERFSRISDVPNNFSLSHRDPNIFALLSKAEIQVGVFSTTLFEGMALGTRTVVIDMPGVEYMRPVVARGDAILVSDVEELVSRLDEAPLAAQPHFYYADPVSPLL